MKKLYTYCKEDGTVIGVSEFETQPPFSTEKMCAESFLKPKLNFETDEFYEGATEEEIKAAKVPAVVSKRQLKQALILAGIPLENIEYAISQIADATEKALMQVFWNDSTEFERNHPKLIEFSQALTISETEADNLFILAASL